MTHDETTDRIVYEFSIGWVEKNPILAADHIALCIREIQESGMEIFFDFSRRGFMKIVGHR